MAKPPCVGCWLMVGRTTPRSDGHPDLNGFGITHGAEHTQQFKKYDGSILFDFGTDCNDATM